MHKDGEWEKRRQERKDAFLEVRKSLRQSRAAAGSNDYTGRQINVSGRRLEATASEGELDEK